MAQRWKVKPKGFATVKRDGWYVKPGAASAPSGGRASSSTRSAARNSLVPREWVGSEGLVGNYAKQPRLDPTKWETLESSETGRWWARPITELTGLGTQAVADIRAFDADTTRQTGRIDQAFADYVAQAGQNAQAGTQALQGLAGLVGSGYSGDPTGAVLSEAARRESSNSFAPVIGDLARMPVLAKDAGVTASQGYAAGRQKLRTETIQGIRQGMAEGEEAQADRAATLRGQELEHLGRLAGLDTDLQEAQIRADTATADRDSRERIATEGNASRERQTEARLRAAEKKAAKKAGRKPPTSADIRQWAKRAREMWDGIPRQKADGSGTEYIQYNSEEIVRELIAAGATRQRAVRIVRNITGNPNIGNPVSGRQVVDLVTGGF